MRDRQENGESLSVFLPGLMGVGIVASMLVLIGDLVRFLVPVTGARRNRQLSQKAHALIANIVRPAGVDLIDWRPEPRVRRHPWFYWLLPAWMAVVATVALDEAFEEYGRVNGLIYHSPWPLIIGILIAATAGLVGLLGVAVALSGNGSSGWARWLVGSTWMGKLVVGGELKLEVKSAR